MRQKKNLFEIIQHKNLLKQQKKIIRKLVNHIISHQKWSKKLELLQSIKKIWRKLKLTDARTDKLAKACSEQGWSHDKRGISFTKAFKDLVLRQFNKLLVKHINTLVSTTINLFSFTTTEACLHRKSFFIDSIQFKFSFILFVLISI